jgi:predicted RNA-binding protein with PIN domain
MRYLVDGYNITKRDPATSELELEAQREALIARLATRASDLLGRGEVVVVFDGRSGAGSDSRRGSVVVRFSRDEPADDLIVRLVRGAGDSVVTSDAGLAGHVRALGATVLGAETCFEATRTRRRRGRYPARSVGIPPGADEITREMERLWLGDEE